MSGRASSASSVHALLVGNGALIAGVYAFGKVAGEAGIPALAVLAWQVVSAAVIVTAIAALRGDLPRLSGANVRYAAIAGFLGVSAPNLLMFSAAPHLPGGVMGAVMAMSPVLTYAIAVTLRLERLGAKAAAGIGIGFLGTALVIGPLAELGPAGCVLIAAAAPLLLACANVFRSTAWPSGLSPLAAASLMLVLQALVLAPVALVLQTFQIPSAGITDTNVALWGAGVFTAVFYLGAFELQKRGGPIMVGQLGQVIAIASLAIGVVAFHERYGVQTLAGVSLVIAGVILVNGGRSPRPSQSS